MTRAAAALLAFALAGGCGGGGGADAAPAGNQSPAPGGSPPAGNPGGTAVVIDGTVTFDLVPAIPGFGLDYEHTQARAARGVTVELVAGSTVLATATTDEAGRYSLTAPADTEALLRVPATMVRTGTPSWDFRVVNNTQDDALYALEGTPFNTGDGPSTRDLHAPSGWDGSAYSAPRSAAPFAILDIVYQAVHFVLEAAPTVTFPPLVLHWSPDNVPSFDEDGAPNLETGEIGSSFFLPALGIYLLGAADRDTDEYDRHVIAHEWGHYFEHHFSRSDSIGGPHTRHDQLDMRVAFGEGFGNALSAMITGNSVYHDVVGPGQNHSFGFDVEGPLPFAGQENQNPGWYSEESIQELLYDLFDDRVDTTVGKAPTVDNTALGFAPLFAVLTSRQRTSVALTSVFPFIAALREQRPDAAPGIDDLVVAQSMDVIEDEYGSNQTRFGDPESPDLQAVYDTIEVNGPAVEVCSLDDFASDVTNLVNKLGSRRFLRFDVAAPGTHTLRAVTTDMPDGEHADPDMVLHRAGAVAQAFGSPSAQCEAGNDAASCTEQLSRSLTAGPHVLEVYEWTNTSQNPDFPPIGRACFAVTVTTP